MNFQLIVNIKIYRKKFIKERSVETDDIFALVKSGSFEFETQNGKYIISENEGALFRKDVFYHRKIISPVTMYFFRYKSNVPLFQEEKIVFSDINRIKSTLSLLETLEDDVFKEEFLFRSSIFSDIVTQYRIENRLNTYTEKPNDAAIQKAIIVIKQSLHKKIALTDIGAISGLSYVQFIRRFKQATGLTPSNYIAQLRMQKAKALLSNTELSIKEIATACGFEDEYYFSSFFKKQLGISPTFFRRSTL